MSTDLAATQKSAKSPNPRNSAIQTKVGYKHTKLGWIPEDWEFIKFGDLTTLKGRIGWRGYTIDDLRDSGPLVIGATQISTRHKIDLSDPVFLSQEKYDESPEIQINLGEIILVKTGNSIGKTALVEDDIGPACINPNTVIVRDFECEAKYLYYWMTFSDFQRQIWSWVAVGAQPSVNQENIRQIFVNIPTLPEQRKIALILSTWDKAISKTELLITKKQERKKGLMQQLLTGKKRFKEFVKSGKMKETKLGWIPEDWAEISFAEIADKKVKWSITGGPFGSDLKSEDFTEAGVRILQLQNLGDGRFIDKYKIYTSEKKADQLKACNIFPGELILSKMGDPVARACMIPISETRYLMASDGIRLVPDSSQYDSYFVLEYINYRIFRRLAIRHSTGSTRQRIGLSDLKKLPFVKPVLCEQQKISNVLSKADREINKLQTQLDQLKDQKKGLMQKLLTGEVRVKIDKI